MSNNVILSYARLWKLMIDKNVNKTQLKDMAQISTNAVAKMGKNEPVSLETIGKICYALDCGIEDVLEIIVERS
jgi:DNA (cytosine-5)-methyltransferase 1